MHSSSGRYGADRQLALMASGLDRSRYRPLAVLPDRGPLGNDLRAGGVEVLVLPVSVIRRELMTATGLASIAFSLTRDVRRLTALIRRRDVGLVHSNTSVVLGGAAAAAATRIPHVWHVREIYSRFGGAWPWHRRLLATAAALPCVSQAAAEQFGTAPGGVRVIHDGLAIDARRRERTAARAELGLDARSPVIAVLGRISDWKGQDVLVRALAEPGLRERGAIGLIAGEAWAGAGDRRKRVLDLAAQLDVLDRLHLVGFREDVETVYGAADVVAVPSTEPDPLPGAAIEAGAAGCAVIAAAHGGLPEIIRDGETGCLVAAGDPRALAHSAAALIDDPARRERLGAAAALDIRRRFAPERLLGAIQSLYDEL
ncbi:MAG: glycosyltransferase [Solirubrobacteraceae bacterium]